MTIEQILSKLKERERPIFPLRLQGYTHLRDQAQVSLFERTGYRVLGFVKQALERSRNEEGQASVTGFAHDCPTHRS